MNGVLNINKPAGMTSHDVVARIRRTTRVKRVGHAGTLDPDATGVLLVCVGPATRIAEYLADEGKAYRATLALGRTTTTEDAGGEVVAQVDASSVTEDALRAVLPRFRGDVSQIPPMVSAVHHEGRRLYELAREGLTVERQARTVRIDALDLIDFTPGREARAILDVACGKGTYIRTLCADIGAALGVGGHMATLCRTRVGAFHVSDAAPLDTLTEANVAERLVSPSAALASLPAQFVDEIQQNDVRHGRALPTVMPRGVVVRVVDVSDNLLALARVEDGLLRPFKVFVTE